MPAYVIVEIDITDPTRYEDYKELTPASIASFDGKFLVRGGEVHTIEGDWHPGRIVVAEFPSMQRAHEWWNSEQYEIAKKIRHESAHTRMIFVDGMPGNPFA